MTKAFDPSPSMREERTLPYGWIQWKGTDVCIDIHCECGELTHYDGDFMYYIQCPFCKVVYECDGHIKLNKMDVGPEELDCCKLATDE